MYVLGGFFLAGVRASFPVFGWLLLLFRGFHRETLVKIFQQGFGICLKPCVKFCVILGRDRERDTFATATQIRERAAMRPLDHAGRRLGGFGFRFFAVDLLGQRQGGLELGI